MVQDRRAQCLVLAKKHTVAYFGPFVFDHVDHDTLRWLSGHRELQRAVSKAYHGLW